MKEFITRRGRKKQIPVQGLSSSFFNTQITSTTRCIDLSHCADRKMKLIPLVGDLITNNQILAVDKKMKERVFRAPFCGNITEIKYGEFRRINHIVVATQPSKTENLPLPLPNSQEEALNFLFDKGLSIFIKQRPFNRSIDKSLPRSIFINCIESHLFEPTFNAQIDKQEKCFSIALSLLAKIAPIKLVLRSEDSFDTPLKEIEVIKFGGSLAAEKTSTHIEYIDPILSDKDNVWTLSTLDILYIGSMLLQTPLEKKVSILGEGVIPECRGTYRVSPGIAIKELLRDKVLNRPTTILAGTPLKGKLLSTDDYLGHPHQSVFVLLEKKKRKFLYFFRPGTDSLTLTNTYLSKLFSSKKFPLFNLQNGEKRPFVVDGRVYDKEMPLKILTIPLIKALMRKDFAAAIDLGFLKIIDEDFVFSTFICPSKIDLCKIVRDATNLYTQEYLA